MFKNFFEARDELDRAILADEFELPEMPESRRAATLAIFRFLLSHTFYNEASYGLVNDKVCATDTIAKLTGYSLSTAKRSMAALADARVIHRQARPKWSGGRAADEITIIWDVFHVKDEAESVTVTPSGGVDDGAESVTPDLRRCQPDLRRCHGDTFLPY